MVTMMLDYLQLGNYPWLCTCYFQIVSSSASIIAARLPLNYTNEIASKSEIHNTFDAIIQKNRRICHYQHLGFHFFMIDCKPGIDVNIIILRIDFEFIP